LGHDHNFDLHVFQLSSPNELRTSAASKVSLAHLTWRNIPHNTSCMMSQLHARSLAAPRGLASLLFVHPEATPGTACHGTSSTGTNIHTCLKMIEKISTK
jgi:hypothetical protein